MRGRTRLALVAGATVLFWASPATAQQSAAPLVVGPQQTQSNILRSGTEVTMRTRTELSSRTSRVGERFDLEVSDPVMLNGQVVIPAGSIAVGEVTRVRPKGMWGRRGILETRLLHVRVADRQIRISGAAGDRGRAGTAGVVASIAFVPVVGFFVTGTSAVIPPGTLTVAYTDEDIPVVFAGNVAPAPLVVPVSQPASTTPSPRAPRDSPMPVADYSGTTVNGQPVASSQPQPTTTPR